MENVGDGDFLNLFNVFLILLVLVVIFIYKQVLFQNFTSFVYRKHIYKLCLWQTTFLRRKHIDTNRLPMKKKIVAFFPLVFVFFSFFKG